VAHAIERHRERQAVERARAGNLWRGESWVFTNHLGGPVHPTVDYEAWKALLRRAKVRTARLHDARHTAATMLLVLKVPLPAVMQIMGWSDASVAKRYMHVPNEFVAAIAAQVGGLIWGLHCAALRPGRRVVALWEVEGMPHRSRTQPPPTVPGSAIPETCLPGEGIARSASRRRKDCHKAQLTSPVATF
jgi:hypothetical protein